MKKSITILIPAYNEERYLEDTVKTLYKILKNMFKDYEILIFDDHSSDNTGKIADKLVKNNSNIRVVHNKNNMGLGYNYQQAVKIAKKEYFGWLPGDNDIPEDSIRSIYSHVGEADIIVPFTVNRKARALHRRVVSGAFTNILNLLFGLHLKYYNGIAIYKTNLIRRVKMRTNSFALQAETLIRMIKGGCSYKEVPMIIRGIEQSKLFRIKNLIGVFTTIVRLFFDVNFRKRKR